MSDNGNTNENDEAAESKDKDEEITTTDVDPEANQEKEPEPERDSYIIIFGWVNYQLYISKHDTDEAKWFSCFHEEELDNQEVLANRGNITYFMDSDEFYTFDITTKLLKKFEFAWIPREILAATIVDDTMYLITGFDGICAVNISNGTITKCTDVGFSGQVTTTAVNGIVYVISRSDGCIRTYNPETKQQRRVARFPVSSENRQKIRRMGFQDQYTLRVVSVDYDTIEVAEHNGKMYTIEGTSNRYLYEYSPDLDEWKTMRVMHPFRITNGKLVSHKGDLYCIGNNGIVGKYNFDNSQWETTGNRERNSGIIVAAYSYVKVED